MSVGGGTGVERMENGRMPAELAAALTSKVCVSAPRAEHARNYLGKAAKSNTVRAVAGFPALQYATRQVTACRGLSGPISQRCGIERAG